MSYTTIRGLMTGIADAVRAKEGSSAPIQNQDLPARIAAIQTGMSWRDYCEGNFDPDITIEGAIAIPDYAFYKLGITSITTGRATIGRNAFSGCASLEDINFTAIESIGTEAFSDCTSLESVTLPEVQHLDNRAFSGCTGLKTLTAGSVRTMDGNPLRGCTALETINVPMCYSAGASTFSGLSSLVSFNAPPLRSIGQACFMNCTALTSLTIKGGTIAVQAFKGCTNLQTLTLTGTTVSSLTDTMGETFAGTPIAAGTGQILVPASLVESYKSATNWATYAAVIAAIPEV